MAIFEVFIPAGGATAQDSTLNIDAPSWVAALRSGLTQLGEQGDAVKNIMVDRKPDQSIMVSHPKSGRVFRIRELTPEEADGAVVMPAASAPPRPKTAPAMPAAPAPAPAPAAAAPALSTQVSAEVAESARRITTSMPAAKTGKHFEVFIPAGAASTSDVTLTVEAANWIGAIKTGLSRIGESADAVKNIMVDRKPDKSFKISHPKSGRVFLVKEITAKAAAKASAVVSAEPGVLRRETAPVQPAFTAEAPPVEAPAAPVAPPVEPAAPAVDDAPPFPSLVGRARPPVAPVPPPAAIPTALRKPVEAAPPTEPAAPPELEIAAPPEPAAPVQPVAPPEPAAPPVDEAEAEAERADTEPDYPAAPEELAPLAEEQLFDADEVLASVFEDTMLLSTMSVHDAIDFALDLALDKVDAEGGSVIVADINSSDMVYASSRGPTATAMLGKRLPMDEGLLGFTMSESVGLSVAEADDPDFFKEISEQAGVEILNVMYAPMEAERRVFGAIELVNRLGSQKFSQDELNVITFLGGKLAEQLLASESTGAVEID